MAYSSFYKINERKHDLCVLHYPRWLPELNETAKIQYEFGDPLDEKDLRF